MSILRLTEQQGGCKGARFRNVEGQFAGLNFPHVSLSNHVQCRYSIFVKDVESSPRPCVSSCLV